MSTTPTSTPPPNPDPGAAPRPLCLVVDDEKDIQRVASRVIESLGYGLVLARDGEEGLALARLYRPQLVLTDALMPRLDGREMGRRIKADPECGTPKVVVMTALYTNMKYKTEGYRSSRSTTTWPAPGLRRPACCPQKHLARRA